MVRDRVRKIALVVTLLSVLAFIVSLVWAVVQMDSYSGELRGQIITLNGEKGVLQELLVEANQGLSAKDVEMDKFTRDIQRLQEEAIEKAGQNFDLVAQLREVDTWLDATYSVGYRMGRESTVLRKLTYAELQDLVAKPNYTIFALKSNSCVPLAMSAREFWRKEGLRVGVVGIFFDGVGSHLAIVFDTADRGEVYIDLLPSERGNGLMIFKEIKVEVGKSYTQQNGLRKPNFNDTIADIITMW